MESENNNIILIKMSQISSEQQPKLNNSPPLILPQTNSIQSSTVIGSKMSLITNALVRYEGILSEVDPILKSMTLTNVKSFGTEGRRNGVKEIIPQETIIA